MSGARVGQEQEQEQSRSRAGAEPKQGSSWNQVGAGTGAGQEREQSKSGSRPGVGQEHGRSMAGAGQERGTFFGHGTTKMKKMKRGRILSLTLFLRKRHLSECYLRVQNL